MYDTLGPVSVDLATGNVTTNAATHSSSALGGGLGLSLTYNNPMRSRKGLVGQYWNNTTRTGTPAVTRVDQNVDFDWNTGNPGIANSDNFSAEWNGYFVAPQTGTYFFGGFNDNNMSITVNGQQVFNSTTWHTDVTFGSAVTLTAGQLVPIVIDFVESTGLANLQVHVKTPDGADQTIPPNWFQTGVRPMTNQRGLIGSYYGRFDGTNTFSSANYLIMRRTDPTLNFNWGYGSPVTNGPNTFLARWTGYVTVPTSGTYKFGTISDDGSKVMLGANNTPVYTDWKTHAATEGYDTTGYSLAANTPTKITIEYYQQGGPASFQFMVKLPGASTGTPVPSEWLSTQAQVLPDGWDMGLDAGGGVSYNRLNVNLNSAVLTDSTGDTHEYTWNGSVYLPPVNEDGVLTRNADGSFVFEDTDGRSYVFAADGTLTSVSSAADDRTPTALDYTYGSVNGGPTTLLQITDPVDTNRWAKLYYAGQSQCGSIPSGFDATPPNMLCALQTNDGRTTYFYYHLLTLARIAQPGNVLTDYQYESVQNNGASVGFRMVAIRDPLANDAIGAGVRADDDTTKTQIVYDTIGRAASVTAPAATSGASRQQVTIEYQAGAASYQDQNGNTVPGYSGMTKEHITGAAEPNGYSRRVKYDDLYRTIEDTDVQGLSTTLEWDQNKDLLLSTTGPTGLKSTTIYDDQDRPIDSYGAAPSSWFGGDRTPLSAYAGQVPHSSTGYESGITSLAAAYMIVTPPTNLSVMANNQTFYPGQNLLSTDHRFTFTYQTDGNLVLKSPNGTEWSSGTNGQASTRLVMQTDGNLVLYNNSTSVWSTHTNGAGNTSTLTVQNNGDLVLRNSNGIQWHTSTSGWASINYSFHELTGAPILHTTNIGGDPAQISRNFGTSSPATNVPSTFWGLRLTGKMILPTTGNWGIRIASDDGLRMWIDDQVVIDDWFNGAVRDHPIYTFNNTTANSTHRVRIDYYHRSSSGSLTVYLTPPGQSETQNVAQYFDPGYSLPTSATVDDSTLGSSTVTTNYGSNPELGFASSSTVDPSGLNLTSTSSYESIGTGFLRQTSANLPGSPSSDPTFSYTYYGATETRDNPCTTGTTETYRQAGMLKLKTEASPDNGTTTGRTTEYIYDDAGRVVASRRNSDAWTCTTYDSRGRVSTVIVPSFNGAAAHTISYDYAVGGNPLVSIAQDAAESTTWTQTTIDLLGRTTTYQDIHGDTTTTTYDNLGRVSQRVSPVGTETYAYDSYNRLTGQSLDGTTYASVYYDQYGRVDHITYPNAGSIQITPGRDSMQRANSLTYLLGDGTTSISDTTTLTQSNRIQTDTVQSGANSLTSTYGYDAAGRLTSAAVGSHSYAYGFGAQDAACGNGSNMNANAGKNGNRTSQTIDGVTTTYCYDYADRLISSSDPAANGAQYDSHGNTTLLGTSTVPLRLKYDSLDRNNGIENYDASGNGKAMYYYRDVTGRIVYREHDAIASSVWTADAQYWYGFTGSGDSPDWVYNASWNIVDKYLHLPGGVLLDIKPQQTGNAAKQYTLPSIEGRTLLTTDASGTNTSTGTGPLSSFAYDPFGNAIGSLPGNGGTGSYGFGGTLQKVTETTLALMPIQMGARVYFPTLGRFASVDPVDGGTPNRYVYVLDLELTQFDGSSEKLVNAGGWPMWHDASIPLRTRYVVEVAHAKSIARAGS